MPPIVKLYRGAIAYWAIIVVAVLGLIFLFRHEIKDAFNIPELLRMTQLPKEETLDEIQNANNEEINDNANSDNTNTSEQLPVSYNIRVPFTVQAPHANWELPYKETCEEASALMVAYFYQKKTFTPEIADREILKLVDFEKARYGFYEDTTAGETARFIRDYWGFKTVRVEEASVEAIKREVASGYPVIIPAAGQQLGNPNFRQPGPLYHMLVVKGYTSSKEFITNDPGTRKGSNYTYNEQTLFNAIHDWNGGDVVNGDKLMIVVEPNS